MLMLGSNNILSRRADQTFRRQVMHLVHLRAKAPHVRRKGQLQACRDVALRRGTQLGDEPPLVLHEGIDTPIRTHLPKKTRAGVTLGASAWYKTLLALVSR